MHQPGAMHGVHGGGERARKSQHLLGARPPPVAAQHRDAVAQGAAVGVLEHQVGLLAGRLVDVVDGDHVGAAHAAQAAALGDEPFADLGVQAVVLGEDLHHDRRIQPLVVGEIGGGEGADAHHLEQPVVAQQLVHQRSAAAVPPASSRPASIARPRLICDFTVPSLRSRRSAISR